MVQCECDAWRDCALLNQWQCMIRFPVIKSKALGTSEDVWLCAYTQYIRKCLTRVLAFCSISRFLRRLVYTSSRTASGRMGLLSDFAHSRGFVQIGCDRLASLCPPRFAQYVRIALTSFQGLTRFSPPSQCPASGVGHFGVTWGACPHHERASVIVRLALCQGLTRVSTAGSTQGKLNERTHRDCAKSVKCSTTSFLRVIRRAIFSQHALLDHNPNYLILSTYFTATNNWRAFSSNGSNESL